MGRWKLSASLNVYTAQRHYPREGREKYMGIHSGMYSPKAYKGNRCFSSVPQKLQDCHWLFLYMESTAGQSKMCEPPKHSSPFVSLKAILLSEESIFVQNGLVQTVALISIIGACMLKHIRCDTNDCSCFQDSACVHDCTTNIPNLGPYSPTHGMLCLEATVNS